MSAHPLQRLAPICSVLWLSAACQLDQEPEGPSTAALRGAGSPPLMAAGAPALRAPAADGGGSALGAAGTHAAPPASQPGDTPTQAGGPATAPEAPRAQAPQPAAAQPEPRAAQPAASPSTPASTPPPVASASARPRSCKPGTYSGSFNGSLELIQLAALSSINGTVRAELVADGPQALQLRNARVVGVDQDQNKLTAVLSGRLNCATHQLEQGKLESGSYHIESLATDAAFSGETSGMHSDDPPSAVGTWQAMADGNAWFGGRGTWNLVLANDGSL